MASGIDRVAIRHALRDRLQAFLPEVREWLDRPVPDGNLRLRPAAALYNVHQVPSAAAPNAPTEWTLDLVLEVHVSGPAVDDQLDAAVDQVEAALKLQSDEPAAYPGSDEVTSLGGLVASCRISGSIDFFSIVEADAAMVEIPITVTAGPA